MVCFLNYRLAVAAPARALLALVLLQPSQTHKKEGFFCFYFVTTELPVACEPDLEGATSREMKTELHLLYRAAVVLTITRSCCPFCPALYLVAVAIVGANLALLGHSLAV